MEWPGADVVAGIPVVLPQRPARHRPRLATEHQLRQPFYLQDGAGYLVPATSMAGAVHRSSSAAGHHRGSASIVINNKQYDDYSPERRARRRSYQDSQYDSDSWDERSRSHERHRSRSRAGSHRHRSHTPSPVDPETERKLHKLKELEKKEQEEEARQKFEEEQILEEARKEEHRKKEEALKKKAVEEYNTKKLEDELKAKKKKEEDDKAFRERVERTFAEKGYSKESIEKLLNSGDEKKKIMDVGMRPTYIKVHRKHLSTQTLDVYELPWKWDDVSKSESSGISKH